MPSRQTIKKHGEGNIKTANLTAVPLVVFPSLTSRHGMILLLSIVSGPGTKKITLRDFTTPCLSWVDRQRKAWLGVLSTKRANAGLFHQVFNKNPLKKIIIVLLEHLEQESQNI